MKITGDDDHFYHIKIKNKQHSETIKYNPSTKTILFRDTYTPFNNFLKKRECQLYRILNNKRRDTFYPGFSLHFILHEKNPGKEKFDKKKITVIERKNNKEKIYKTENKSAAIPEIFTDGAYIQSQKRGAYSVLLRIPGKPMKIYSYETKNIANNSLELLAVIHGVKLLKKHKKIRVVTDSQYVIKGISEWTINWRINNWRTANGNKVKDKKRWKLLWKLLRNKYIELQWVKSHHQSAENKLCDFHSRHTARQKN